MHLSYSCSAAFWTRQSRLVVRRTLMALTAFTLLSACESSNNNTFDPLDDDSSPPSMPMELTGTVYSAHEIELFWIAASDDGWVMGYDIYRDGSLLTEQLDATSYFDDRVEPATEYVYTVLAVDDGGNRSTPASLTLVTPAATARPLVNRNNYAELLSHAFKIYVGDIYNMPLIALSDFTIEGRNPDGTFIDIYNCTIGGFSQSLDPSSTLAGVGFLFDFDSCFENGVVYDGTLSGRKSGYSESLSSTNGFSMQTHPELKSTFSGSATFNTSMSRGDTLHQWDTVGVSWNSRTVDGNLQLDSVTSTFGYGETGGGVYRSWLNGGFNVRSDSTSGALLAVHTPVGLSYECDPRGDDDPRGDLGTATPCSYQLPHSWTFTSGQLELVAEDGSTLLLDADTPSHETANITISNEHGVETFQAPWSQWQPLLSFKRYAGDSSDWVSPQNLASAELDAKPAITPENYEALLNHAFDIHTGYSALKPLRAAQNFLDDSPPALTDRALGVRTDSYICDPSGTATALRVDNDDSTYPLDYRVSFKQCEFKEYLFDGYTRGQEIRTNGGAVGIGSSNLQWLDGSGNDTAFRGQASAQRIGSGSNTVCTWNANQVNLHTQSETSAESVITGGTHFEAQGSDDTGITATLSGGFQVTSELTGGFEIAVNAVDLKTSNSAGIALENWNFSEGDLTIRAYDKSFRWASDRSSLEYHAEDSIIKITNSEGSYTIDAPWTSWQSRMQSALDRLCGET